MTDITLLWQESKAAADWTIVNGTIGVGSDLQSAVIVSLFSDRRAPDDYKPADGELRGWWGDTYSQTPWGSRLWMLDRAANSGANNLQRQARDYCREALQWLLDDGVAASVDVTVVWLTGSALGITIRITEPTGKKPVFQFSWAWASIKQGG